MRKLRLKHDVELILEFYTQLLHGKLGFNPGPSNSRTLVAKRYSVSGLTVEMCELTTHWPRGDYGLF